MIDFKQVVTAEEKASAAREAKLSQIKAEASRRIEAIAPIWKQVNSVRAGKADKMWKQVDLIRKKSDAIEALEPLPDDVTDDKLWK